MGTVIIAGECESARFLSGFSIINIFGSGTVNAPEAAVILGKGADITIVSALAVTVDADSFSEKLPAGIRLVTCGVSPKNTVSITSRTPERLTLSLNRAVNSVSGICEPLEYPVRIPKNASEYDIMAAFAAKLLLS